MAKKNIYKVDNYCFAIGVLLLILGLSIFVDPRTYNEVTIRQGTSYTFENKNGRTVDQIRTIAGADEVIESRFPLIRSIIGVNGLIILSIGITYRRRENKIIAVWNALDRTGEAKVNDLAVSLGLDRAFITGHLKDINAQRGAYYVWDQGSDKIVDGKLMTDFLLVTECKSCGSKIDEKISFDQLSPPKCKYCGNPVSVPADLNKLKQDILLTRDVATGDEKKFNVGIFVALLIFFWPGAIVYLVLHRGSLLSLGRKICFPTSREDTTPPTIPAPRDLP
jgi:hypothetical protein